MARRTRDRRPSSVVLVHGMWSGPYDWRWIAPLLQQAGVRVLAVDLPTHSSPEAGPREDGEAVRAAIRACEPPVVVAAWSAGGDSMDLGAEGESGVARLVYLASSPSPPHGEMPESTEWIDEDPLIRRLGDGTFVLDTDLWLQAESQSFDSVVLAHLQEHRRRPVSLRVVTEATSGRAWATIPFTVLLGRSDPLIPSDDTIREIADLVSDTLQARPDIRVVDCDHFMPFRIPSLIAELILEPLP